MKLKKDTKISRDYPFNERGRIEINILVESLYIID
jgi:hypothetical protein